MNTLQEQIQRMGPWFHNLHLPDGTQTIPDHQLGDFPNYKWKEIAPFIPLNLSGMRVLDIGCNAGFYTIELAKRGAQVTGIDIDNHYLSQAAWAAGLFGLTERIVLKQMQIYDLARQRETYDLVWYMGVFYHLRYPLLSLDIISRITKSKMVFQTMTMPGTEECLEKKNVALFEREILNQDGWPKMAFVEHCIAGDPTNWWAPNHSAVMAMLRSTGFKVVNCPAHEIYICERDKNYTISDSDMRYYEFLAATGLSK